MQEQGSYRCTYLFSGIPFST